MSCRCNNNLVTECCPAYTGSWMDRKDHNYRPRYDEIPVGEPFRTSNGDWLYTKRDVNKIYVHDICIRCGDIKKRSL